MVLSLGGRRLTSSGPARRDRVAVASTHAETVGRMFDQHAEGLLRYLTRRVGRHVAEDLVSETFAVMLREQRDLDPARGGERAWLFGIATNLLRHHLRDQVRAMRAAARAAGSHDDRVDDQELSAVERLDAQRRVAQLATALAALNADDREVLLLVAWGGLSPSEAADALDIPAGTARSRLHRIRRDLRQSAAALDIGLPLEEDPS